MDLGRRSAAAGDDEKALNNFQKLLIVQPDHKEGKTELLLAESRLAKRQAARLRRVARTRAIDQTRLAKKAQASEEKKEWENALEVWLRINTSSGNVATEIDRCRAALYQKAEKAQETKDFSRAQALFHSAERGGSYRDTRPARAR